jgi:hypothetical protein
MITQIEYNMERCFNTVNPNRTHIEMGFHAYPDPLATGVICAVINNVAYPMECLLHVHIMGRVFHEVRKQYKDSSLK